MYSTAYIIETHIFLPQGKTDHKTWSRCIEAQRPSHISAFSICFGNTIAHMVAQCDTGLTVCWSRSVTLVMMLLVDTWSRCENNTSYDSFWIIYFSLCVCVHVVSVFECHFTCLCANNLYILLVFLHVHWDWAGIKQWMDDKCKLIFSGIFYFCSQNCEVLRMSAWYLGWWESCSWLLFFDRTWQSVFES